ncbi:MAG: zinc-binding dehydrogenase [Propionibacteriaceae bacterium]|nr:zinc-binding dehydrogenase [Micropruina sp.]HBX81396.1 zinc-binding dehydrogenase [Propionibacteriaceae bacterium]HBY23077.1 zinc-binding dehydrogenase [Propionibacteriaceae bacterium]
MWAMQYHRYGAADVIQREEAAAPTLATDEVLVRTTSSGVSAIDLMYRAGQLRIHGFGFPKQPGFDALGQVVESRNPAIRPGTWVWTVLGLEPRRTRGTAVELLTLDPSRVGVFPDDFVPDPTVGSLPLGALTALKSLRDIARLQRGERVLIVGAGGAVGTAAVQLATILGARADAVCGAKGLELCAALGAEQVVDHADADVQAIQHGHAYDVVLVAAGRGTDWLDAVRPGGRMVLTRLDTWVAGLPAAWRGRVRTLGVAAGHDSGDLTWLAQQVAAGGLRPTVGVTYPMTDLARAHADYGHGGTAGARLIVHAT